MSSKKKVLQTQAQEDPVEKVLLGDVSDFDLENLMELQLARRSRSSLSDAILLYLFIEKIREKEKNEILSALQNAREEEREIKKRLLNIIDRISDRLDKVMSVFMEVYIPFRLKLQGSQGGVEKTEVEIDAE
jgi:hypothetical protein